MREEGVLKGTMKGQKSFRTRMKVSINANTKSLLKFSEEAREDSSRITIKVKVVAIDDHYKLSNYCHRIEECIKLESQKRSLLWQLIQQLRKFVSFSFILKQ